MKMEQFSSLMKRNCILLLVVSMLAGGKAVPVFAAETDTDTEDFLEESISSEEGKDALLKEEDEMETSEDNKESANEEEVSETEKEESFDTEVIAQDEAKVFLASVGKITGLKTKCTGSKSIKLTWNHATGANTYIILRMKSGSRAKQIGYTSQNYFVDSSADDMDFNFYWVVPYYINSKNGIKAEGPLSSYVYAVGRYIEVVRNLKASAGKNGIKLTWSSATGANAYVVLSKTGSSKSPYNKAVTVTGTSYVDTAAPSGKVTYYWVHGVYQKNKSSIAAGPMSSYAWAIRNNSAVAGFTRAQAQKIIYNYLKDEVSYFAGNSFQVDSGYGSRESTEYVAFFPVGEAAFAYATVTVNLDTGDGRVQYVYDNEHEIYETFGAWIETMVSEYDINLYDIQ